MDEVEFRLWGRNPSRLLALSKARGDVGLTVSNGSLGPGVLVSELSERGQAAAAGFRVGDVILSVNGLVVTTHAKTIELVDAAAPTDELRFVVIPVASPAELDGDAPALQEFEA